MALEIHPMNLGEAACDMSLLYFGATPGEGTWIPCTSYLILGGEVPTMVDSGFRDAEELSAGSGYEFRRSPEQTLEANLASHGLVPEDIGMLFFTHVHIDHSGLADRVPNARILLQRRELQYAAAPDFPPAVYDRTDVAKLIDPLWDRVELLDGDTDVAPGMRAVVTGGHSAGHQMLYVDVPSGTAAVLGDLVYLVDPGIVNSHPPGFYRSMEETTLGIARVRREAVHFLPSHDASVFTTYPDGVL